MSVYLDASVLLPMMVTEPNSDSVQQFLSSVGTELWVSEFAAAEFASGISRLLRMGLLAPDTAQARLVDFDSWRAAETNPADIEPSDIHAASAIVRRFDLKLRAPDALHLAICRRFDAGLATLHKRLATASEALGVKLATIS